MVVLVLVLVVVLAPVLVVALTVLVPRAAGPGGGAGAGPGGDGGGGGGGHVLVPHAVCVTMRKPKRGLPVPNHVGYGGPGPTNPHLRCHHLHRVWIAECTRDKHLAAAF